MAMRILSAGILAAFTLGVAAQETYVVDPAHSQPQYETVHVGFSVQRGSFGKLTGKVVLDRAARKGSVDFTIDASSIRTHDPRTDSAVKGERYFNVDKYPTITFKSSKLAFDGDRLVGLDGDLTMLGVTSKVT